MNKINSWNIFDEWNDVSGVFERDTGYYGEIEGVIEDIIKTETKTLRQQNAELIEMCEKLAEELEIFVNEHGHNDINGDDGKPLLSRNTALMSRIKGE